MRKWKFSWISDVSGKRIRTTKAWTSKTDAKEYATKQLHPKTKPKIFSIGTKTKRSRSKSLLR
jgi:hypothetical protein